MPTDRYGKNLSCEDLVYFEGTLWKVIGTDLKGSVFLRHHHSMGIGSTLKIPSKEVIKCYDEHQ